MFCPECGAKVDEGAAFCEECGAKADFAPQMSAQPESPPLGAGSPTLATSFRAYRQGGSSPEVTKSKPQAGRATALAGLGLWLLSLTMTWIEVDGGPKRIELPGNWVISGAWDAKLPRFHETYAELTGSQPGQIIYDPWLAVSCVFFLIGAVASIPKSPTKAVHVWGVVAALISCISLYLFYERTPMIGIVQRVMNAQGAHYQVSWSLGPWIAFTATILLEVAALIRLVEIASPRGRA